MMFHHWVVLIAMAAAMTASSSVGAQDASVGGTLHMFDDLDTNHDGGISRSELPRDLIQIRTHFSDYDKDGNQRLSRDEYQMALVLSANRGCSTAVGIPIPECRLGVREPNEALRERPVAREPSVPLTSQGQAAGR